MNLSPTARWGWLTRAGALRVPQITAYFWLVKGLSTAMGEATSDAMVHAMPPVLAVLLGFAGFLLALALQFRMGRYSAWTYWFAVVMVGVFGTMAADVVHVALGVPYPISTAFYAVVLAGVFIAWYRVEHTLSIHTVDTYRREAFYWAAVVATFAMGTALGDFTAYTLGLGYFPSALVFAVVIAIPASGYRWAGWNAIFSFWFAYVATRPLGASIADWLGKPPASSGLGIGDGLVAVAFAAVIAAIVAYLAITKADVQSGLPDQRAH
ncbi:MAG: COG4705 family protein [Candidatus Dormibacteria bacterium]